MTENSLHSHDFLLYFLTMSDSGNKDTRWHLKTREPVHGMDLGYGTYCELQKWIPEEKDSPSSLHARKKGTKSKPR